MSNDNLCICGEGGIRTHGTTMQFNGFRDRPVQPLRHLSKAYTDYKFNDFLTDIKRILYFLLF
jgi:hypothetical protein